MLHAYQTGESSSFLNCLIELLWLARCTQYFTAPRCLQNVFFKSDQEKLSGLNQLTFLNQDHLPTLLFFCQAGCIFIAWLQQYSASCSHIILNACKSILDLRIIFQLSKCSELLIRPSFLQFSYNFFKILFFQ